MRFDIHTHHERCGHAYGSIEDYILKAIELEMRYIGISDHCPDFSSTKDHPSPRLKMARSEFPNYAAEVLKLKGKYNGKIEVLFGVESDIIPGQMERYQLEYDRYSLDYIIGSVHAVDNISIFAQQKWETLNEMQLIDIKTRYFQLLQQAARSRTYHILGHIDALKTKFPHYDRIALQIVDETLKVIGEQGGVIEVNTSGDKKGLEEWFPSLDILERANYYGVEITFGSDAHRPEHLGAHWNEATSRLKEIGYRRWSLFVQQKKIKVLI